MSYRIISHIKAIINEIVRWVLIDTNCREGSRGRLRYGFGMLMRHIDTLSPDSITFCDEHVASVHVY